MPKVSVIILTYNRPTLVKRAIQSVMAQTFQDFELIVVDDCSTDHTPQVMKNYSDSRVKYIRHEINKGEAGGRNTGLKHATGEYIGYLDDDDEWLPTKLQLQVETLDRSPPEIGAVHCGRVNFDVETGRVLSTFISQEKGALFSRLLKGNFLTLSSILVRANCFEAVGVFDLGIPMGLDYDMWLRISQKFHFECINQPLVKYGVHHNKMSSNLNLLIRGSESWLRKYGRFIEDDPKECHRRYCAIGELYFLNGNISIGRAMVLKAIKKYPRGFRAYLIFCLSFLGRSGYKNVKEIIGKKRIALS